MTAEEITLNIAVNLGRLGRWVHEGRSRRIDQFLRQTEEYVNQLENIEKKKRFEKTLVRFKDVFATLKQKRRDDAWAESAFTWANILTHRAKLA